MHGSETRAREKHGSAGKIDIEAFAVHGSIHGGGGGSSTHGNASFATPSAAAATATAAGDGDGDGGDGGDDVGDMRLQSPPRVSGLRDGVRRRGRAHGLGRRDNSDVSAPVSPRFHSRLLQIYDLPG
jgi:hypothetical protein